MSRPVSGPTAAELEKPSTEPGYLIEIGLPGGTLRHCSRGTVPWAGFVWISMSVRVEGIEGGGQRGALSYFDHDAAMRTAVLNSGINDRPVKIWKFYGAALASGDPVQIFAGVGDGAQMQQGRVSIGLARSGSRTLVTPRLRIGPGIGFNHLPPDGTIVNWAGRTLRLTRGRS